MHRFLTRWLALGALLSLVSPLLVAHADSTEHIFDSTADSSEYAELFMEGGIPLLDVTYEQGDLIFSNESEKEEALETEEFNATSSEAPLEFEEEAPFSEDGLFLIDETYSFTAETTPDALWFTYEVVPTQGATSPTFRMDVEHPDGHHQIYYALPDFLTFQPKAGTYSFTVYGSGFSDYSLTVNEAFWTLPPPDPEEFGAFLVDKNQTFSESQLSLLREYILMGGHIIVLSNDAVAEAYGYDFSSFDFNRSLNWVENQMKLGPLRGQTIDLLNMEGEDTYDCADFSYVEIPEGVLFSRLYCPGEEDTLGTIAFLSEDFFQLLYEEDEELFLFNLLTDLLQPPNVVSFNIETPSFIFSSFDFQSFLNSHSWVFYVMAPFLIIALILFFSPKLSRWIFESLLSDQVFSFDTLSNGINSFIQTVRHKARKKPVLSAVVFLVLVSPFIINWYTALPFLDTALGQFKAHSVSFLAIMTLTLSFLLVFLFWLFPERLFAFWPLIKSQGMAWGASLPKPVRRGLFWGFVLVMTIALYDFFFVHWHTTIVFGFALILGLINGFSWKTEHLSFSWETRFLKVIHALVAFLPIAFILTLLLANAHFSSTKIIHWIAFEDSPKDPIALDSPSSIWAIPGGAFMITGSPLTVQIDPDFIQAHDDLEMEMKIQSNTSLYLHASDFQNNFIKTLFYQPLIDSRFSVAHEFEDDLMLYRKIDAPTLKVGANDMTSDYTWEEFLQNYLPQETTLAMNLLSYYWHIEDFLIDHLSLDETAPFVEASPRLYLNGSETFYTYCSNSFLLDATLSNSTVTGNNYRKGQFLLKNGDGEVLLAEDFSLDDDRFSFEYLDLPEGVYEFSFFVPEETLLQTLSLNSSLLVLNTAELTTLGDHQLFLKNPSGEPLLYFTPETDLPFEYLGGVVTSTNGVIYDGLDDVSSNPYTLYQLTLPPVESTLKTSSTASLLYSFSSSSWFNPFQFYFTPLSSYTDYALIEDYDGPFSTEEEWSLVTRLLQDSPREAFDLQLHFGNETTTPWVLVEELTFQFL